MTTTTKSVLSKAMSYKLDKKNIYVYGAGRLARDLIKTLEYLGKEVCFIDNNTSKQTSGYMKRTVISYEDYLKCRQDEFIIVAASETNTNDIVTKLQNSGLTKGTDFCTIHEYTDEILPYYFFKKLNKSYLPLCQIVLTERCSLKCKKCAHACYAVSNDVEDLSLDEVFSTADHFFAKVDFVSEFVLIGGEPLLYKDLDKAIEYIGSKYIKQIGVYSVTTNGTIVPSKEVLEASKKYNVMYRISNYEKTIPRLIESHKKLIKALEEYNITYVLGNPDNNWMDYGFEYVDRKGNIDELKDVFNRCKTPCREVRENRLYYCVMARTVSDNLNMGVGRDDYLDLSKLDVEKYKEEILAFQLGYLDKGYLEMCNFCHGADAKNYPIPVAEQVLCSEVNH